MVDDGMIGFPKDDIVCCRFWDDECVIYQHLTGETHLVDGMGAEIFRLVSEKTVTRTQLLENIHAVFEWESDFDAEGVLNNLITEYRKLGLLEVTESNPA